VVANTLKDAVHKPACRRSKRSICRLFGHTPKSARPIGRRKRGAGSPLHGEVRVGWSAVRKRVAPFGHWWRSICAARPMV